MSLDGRQARGGLVSHHSERASLYEAAVRSATLEDLLLALGSEPESYWSLNELVERWTCPQCQPPKSNRRAMHCACATVGEVSWTCWCGASGTLWGARRAVLEDLAALERLVELVSA